MYGLAQRARQRAESSSISPIRLRTGSTFRLFTHPLRRIISDGFDLTQATNTKYRNSTIPPDGPAPASGKPSARSLLRSCGRLNPLRHPRELTFAGTAGPQPAVTIF
jgi:hypothetical protein